MAITRSQQARQMLKKGTSKPVVQGGVDNYLGKQPQVVAPRKWQSSPDAPPTELAYITKAEKDLILKKDIHGSLKKGPNMGPSGIMSLDSFGDADGSGMAGGDVSRAERGDFGPIGGGGSGGPQLPPGVKSKPTKLEQDLRSSFIAAGGGRRVNPGFFDSRNTVSPAELAAAKAFAPRAFAKSRRGSILDFITGGGITGALIRGLGQRFGFGKRFNQPTYDMSRLSNLPFGGSASFQNLDIRDKYNRLDTDDDTTNIDEFGYSPNFLSGLVDEVALTGTPEQKQLIKETSQELAEDDFLKNAMADVSAKDINRLLGTTYGATGQQKYAPNTDIDTIRTIEGPFLNPSITDQEIKDVLNRRITEPTGVFAADGGMIGGGIMDAAGRQQYFLGKLVKKAGRALKKIVKSPVGKLGLGALVLGATGGFGKDAFLRKTLLPRLISDGKLTGMGKLGLGAAISAAPLLFQEKEDEGEQLASMGSVGGQIDPRAYTDPYGVLFSAFKAEGGSMKDEPVAKRTMPLLDMGGQEMDLRAEGGFVPIGRMEKADDVPARLSKNEFVFTAEAVRNAGDGDVDKGAEVMYNMMKNLESGGDVSEESQGLEGARNMFQTSKRLEEVI